MTVAPVPRTTSSPDDEKGLLIQLELLLEREQELLGVRDAAGIIAVAEERERLIERLGDAARRRRALPRTGSDADEADLVELYRRLRHGHDVRAQVLRGHADRNATAMRVLAQASGDVGLYQADGSVRMQFVSV
jgi:flagellar biosynthesis/type III secretory pathway chaperone